MDRSKLTPLQKAAVDAMVWRAVGDTEASIGALDVILDAGDPALMASCCAWAETVNQLALGGNDGGFTSLEIVDPVTGRQIAPEDVNPALAPQVWAGRFLAMISNGDMDGAFALFVAARRDPDKLGDGVMELLDMAAAAVRQNSDRLRRRRNN